jgi:hypothetical protein
MVLKKVQLGLLILAALTLLTSCRHSEATSSRTQSTAVSFVTPHVVKAQAGLARHSFGHTASSLAGQRIECRRYGTLALNCFVFRPGSCTVVGVRETARGEFRYSGPFGVTICGRSASSG